MLLKHPIRCLSAGFNHAGSRPVAQEIRASASCSAHQDGATATRAVRAMSHQEGYRPPGRWSSPRDDEAASFVTPSELRTVLPLARHRPRDQRPDPPVHPRVLPAGPGPGHGDRQDAAAADRARPRAPGPATRVLPTCSQDQQSGDQPDQNPPGRTAAERRPPGRAVALPLHDGHRGAEHPAPDPRAAGPDIDHVRGIAASLPEQGSTSPGGLCGAEGSRARTRRLTPWRLGSAPS